MADWQRITNTTIKNYIRDQEINVLRNRKITALMKDKGRISFNRGGDGFDWKVRFKRVGMQGYADTDTLTFSRINKWQSAGLDYRGYAAVDSMTKMERLKNKSVEAIVNVYSEITKTLMEDVEDQFGDEFYIDGGAAGNGKRMHGIESFVGNSGTQAAGMVATPSQTYAGLKTDLGNFGGSWTTTNSNVQWPLGTGDAHYDFWSPLLVDYTNTVATNLTNGTNGWATTTATWAARCVECLRYGFIHSRKNKTPRGNLDFTILNDEMYRLFLMALDGKERIVVNRGTKSGGLQSLGFDDVTNMDGVEVTFEYGVPQNVGYGWNIDQLELRSMQGQLFVSDGIDYDIASKSWRFSVDFFGNARFNPRYFVKFKNYT